MDVPSVTVSTMRPVFAVPPVRSVPRIAREPDFVDEMRREAPRDRIELSAEARRAMAGLPAEPAAPSFQPYQRGSIASPTA